MDTGQFEHLLNEIAASRRHADALAAGLRQEIADVATGLRQEIVESRRHTDEVATGLRQEIVESRRHFVVLAEGIRHDVQTVAEGVAANTERIHRLDGRVEGLDGRVGKLEVRMGVLEFQMKEGFTEVKSLIHSSCSELDHRLRAVEGAA